MKNYFIFIFFILAFVFVFVRAEGRLSVSDIINQYIAARGGIDKLNAISSICMEGRRIMMGGEARIKITKVKGNLFRTDLKSGESEAYSIITPHEGWTYHSVSLYEADRVPAEELKNRQTDMDIAGPLVNYEAKGYQVFLDGKEMINEKLCYKIKLVSSDNNNGIYFIDVKTNLLFRSIQTVKYSGKNAGNITIEMMTDYSDYKDYGGVLFPQSIITQGSGINYTIMLFDKIEWNIPVEEKWYKPG
ncbi:MAG: hypothetical protein ABIR03_14245 [Ginsengibacter sp.]